MRSCELTLLSAFVLAGLGVNVLAGQSAVGGSADAYVATARAAARKDHAGLLDRLCTVPPPSLSPQPAAAPPPGVPERSRWRAEPAKVFDNLYFVRDIEYSASAVP